MSTIIIDTITGKSTATTVTIGSTPVVSASANSMTIRGEGSAQTSIQQGLCKAWANYTSVTTTAYRDSFNFGSITDNGTGDTTHTFTNAMSNNDYSVVSSASAVETGTASLGGSEHPRTYATGSFSHVTATGAGSLTDRPHVNNEVLGDLA